MTHDWTRFDAMTEAERHAAAVSDTDAQPLAPEDMTRMTRTPQARIIRRAASSRKIDPISAPDLPE